jgi:competence protein ComEA
MYKQFISDYLNFTKKERTGILVLLFLVIFFITLPFTFPYFIKQNTYDHTGFEKAIAALKIKQPDSSWLAANRNQYNPNYKKNDQLNGQQYEAWQPKGELFYFDPNSASLSEWKRLGLRDKTIATIQNYLSKGGKFKKKEDIGKIWGLHEDEVQRLMPFVQIKITEAANDPLQKQQHVQEYKNLSYTPAVVDVNTGDTAAFIALPGIGSKLSQRIINFREKLGGFYSVDQISETFGLPDSTYQKIKLRLKIGNTEIKRININLASVDEMKLHPYLRYAFANAIFQYRTQHGNYNAVTDIKKIMVITEEVYQKLVPYLTVN